MVEKAWHAVLWAGLMMPLPGAMADATGPHFEATQLEQLEYEEVSFRNREQDIDLAALRFLPAGKGEFPMAVIIHGSGTSRRTNGWYLTLVNHLVQHGIAVLLPDKRGSEASGGDWRTASIEDLSTDTLAALDYIESGALPISSIGIIGLSQGGQVAAVVGASRDDLDFIVSVVSAAVPLRRQLVYEERYNLEDMGVPAGLSRVLAYPAAWSLTAFRQKAFWDAIGKFDSLDYWARVESPTLMLFGSEDTNVPTARSVSRLRDLNSSHIAVKVFEGSGHALETPPGQPRRSIFRQDALKDIVDFIDEQ